MKKITLSFFMMIFTICGYAQLAQEGFETWPVNNSGGPDTWKSYNDVTDAPQSTVTWARSAGSGAQVGCGNSTYAAYLFRENLPSPPNGRPIDWLISKQFLVPTNPVLRFCTKLTRENLQGAEFDIRISENAAQMAYGNYVSLIDGTTGTFPLSENQLMENESHLTYITKAINIPISYVGKNCYIAFVMKGTLNNGDSWFVDNVGVDTRCTIPGVAPTVATNITTSGATLNWTNTSGATSHEIQVVLASASPGPSGTVVTATTSIAWPVTGQSALAPDTDYKFYVRALCSPTNPSDWAGPFNFSTIAIGSKCAEPIVINTLPYQTTNNTSNFGDFYELAPGASCNGGGTALNGNDVIYKYTAIFTGPININLTNNGINSGMFVYTSCANIGVACATGGVGNGVPINLNNFNVTTGQDYYIVISTAGTTQTTPYTLTIQAASCAQPTSTAPTTGIGPYSATLSWNPVATGITSWEIVVQPVGGGIPQGAGVQTNNNTAYPAGGLLEATAYEYWVRNDCNNSTFSAWAGPYFFTTTQVPAALTYTQDFEGTPTGFSLVNGTQANKWVVGTAVNNGGTKSLYVSNDNGVTNAYTGTTASTVHAYKDIIIPTGAYEMSVSFDWKNAGDINDYFRVWLVPDNFTVNAGQQITAAANQRVKIGVDFNSSTTWTNSQYTINVSQFAGTTRRIVFEWRNNATISFPPPAAIDNINIRLITCSQPTGLTVADATPTGATFTWTAPPSAAVSYDYYYSTSDTPPTDTTPVNGNTTALTVTPTDFVDNTTYYFWVRTVCSDANGKSFWTGPVSVMTPQIPAILTYNQNFEGTSTGFTFVNGTSVNKWVVGEGTNNGGTKSMYISNTPTNTYGYTNTVNTPAVFAYRDFAVPATIPTNNQIEVSFDWKADGDANDYLRVWLVPTSYNPVAGTVITNAADRQQIPGNFNLNGTWTSVTNIMGVTPGQNRRIVFEWRNNATGGVQPPAAIDNLNIKVLTCVSPIATLGAVTANSAVLLWVAPNPIPASYDYFVSTNISNVPGAGTTPTGSVALPTVTLGPELAGSTNFYFWVRSNCGSGDYGRWIGPLQFGLPQVSAPLNYVDNMEGNIGWTVANGTQVNKWVVGSAVSSSVSTSLYVSNNNGQGNNYTIGTSATVHAYRDIQIPTPGVDISVSFQWKGGGEGANDRLRVWSVPSTFIPTAGTQITATTDRRLIGTFSEKNTQWNNESFVVPSMAYAGLDRRIVFEWANNASVGTQPAMAIDNFNFRIITCPAVINPVVTGGALVGDVFLSWTPVGPETAWELVIQVQDSGLPGANPVTVIPVTGAPNYTFSATAGTFYEYYVRPVCAPDDKGLWAGPTPFSVFSPPACAKVDLYDEDLEVVAPGTNFSLCPGEDSCVELTADYLQTGSTASYAVETIDYAPQFPFTGGIQLNIATDDIWGPAFNFPADFNFCFYGQKQTKATVGSNGVVSFNTHAVNSTCPWDLNGLQIPNTAFPIRNAIYGVYQDINPRINNAFAQPTINYQILGTYPCRAFVVNFSEVAQFGTSCQDNATVGAQTSQIVFYEISNIVEVYVQRRVPCMSWPTSPANEMGQGVIGIQNAAGTAAVAAPGRNTGPWTATNEAYRFTPNGPSNVQFGWYEGTTLLSTNDNISVCVTGNTPRTVIARATYSGCGSDTTVVETPVTITPEQPIIITTTTDLIECPITGNTATFNLRDGIVNGVTNPTAYTYTFYNTEAEAIVGDVATQLPSTYTTATKTIWVRVQLTGRTCFAVDSFEVTVSPAPTFDFPADFTICEGTPTTIAITNPSFDPAGTNVSYEWNGGALPDTGSSITVTTAGTYTVKVNVGGCIVTKSVTVTASPLPTADDPADVAVCGSYTLPALSPDNNYYTAAGGPNGTGVMLNANDVITTTQTLYVYVQGATPDCFADNSFIVTIDNAPVLTAPADVTVCLSYALPALTVGNYFDGPGGTGNMLDGTTITTTQQVYIYAAVGPVPCTAEVSFNVNITPGIAADVLANEVACESFELQPLSANNNYYTGSGATGTMLTAGSFVTSTQTIYVYAQSGTCTNESSFVVTIDNAPAIVAPSNPTACQSYTLPNLPVGNYYDGPNGTGNMLAAGTAITSTQLIYIYATAGTIPCITEVSFTVNITPTIVADDLADEVACESFQLLALSPNNSYYTGSNKTGQMLTAGSVITTSQTIYVYAEQGTCNDEDSFVVTIVPKPLPVTIDGGCQGGQYVLTAVFDPSDANYSANNVSFAWSRSAGGAVIATTPSIVAAQSGDYYLTVSPNGSSVSCSVTANFDVTDNSCVIQRGISPNNDGLNDNFDLTAYSVTNISIFNRYGKEVYSYGVYTNEWHGQDKSGGDLPTGTYFYSYKRATGENVTGWIYINREEN